MSFLIDYQEITLSEWMCIKEEVSLYCFNVSKKNEKAFPFPTYFRDIDMEIMSRLNTKVLQAACLSERYLAGIANDNNFWRLTLSHIFQYNFPLTNKEQENYRVIFEDLAKTKLDPDALLAIAAKYGLIKVVATLMDRGSLYSRYYYAVRLSIEANQLETVRYLIEQSSNRRGLAAYNLYFAAQKGYTNIVAYLIEKGALIRHVGDGALKVATENGHTNTIAYLINHGVHIHDEVFRLAAGGNHTDTVAYLIKLVGNNPVYIVETLSTAIANDSFETADYLIGLLGPGTNLNTLYHYSAGDQLFGAARAGKTSRVAYLLKHGADLHALEDGALRIAVEEKHVDTAAFLLEWGANVKARNHICLKFAATARNVPMVKLLLQYYPPEAYCYVPERIKWDVQELLEKDE